MSIFQDANGTCRRCNYRHPPSMSCTDAENFAEAERVRMRAGREAEARVLAEYEAQELAARQTMTVQQRLEDLERRVLELER